MINGTLHSTDSRDEVTDNVIKSFQIQEQEMLVLSKQCFYVMSHVCKSVGKIDEAKKCLDKIEIYIDEQKQKDSEQYKDAMKRITKSDKYHTENIGSNLSGFALEGKSLKQIISRNVPFTFSFCEVSHVSFIQDRRSKILLK